MKYVLAASALALCMGSVAMASDQLARQLGVEPGVYTNAQLAVIKAAQEEDDSLALKWAMGQTDIVVSTQSIGGGGRMDEQLARTVGADPADHSTAELTYMFFDQYAD